MNYISDRNYNHNYVIIRNLLLSKFIFIIIASIIYIYSENILLANENDLIIPSRNQIISVQNSDILVGPSITKLTETDTGELHNFGDSVAIGNNTAVVGVPRSNTITFGYGDAYIYKRESGGGWTQVTRLVASHIHYDSHFGRSVAIDGDIVVVGAPDYYEKGFTAVFERNQGGLDNWGEVAFISNPTGDFAGVFGISVSISGDIIAIGKYNAVCIYYRDRGGINNWGLVKVIYPDIQMQYHNFGESVSLDGNTLVVGAPRDDEGGTDSGAAYIFYKDEDGIDMWGQIKKINHVNTGDLFGISVGIKNDTVVIGAPNAGDTKHGKAYIYNRNLGGNDQWGYQTSLLAQDYSAYDWFGGSVFISGNKICVGAKFGWFDDFYTDKPGKAYVFELDGTSWTQAAKLLSPDGVDEDKFGCSVALDSNTIIVGAFQQDEVAPDGGAAYIYEYWDADLGDSPNPYPTTIADNGPWHVLDPLYYLGTNIDDDPDGQPSIEADGDDIDNMDDEDGVSVSSMNPGLGVTYSVVASVEGFLDAWVDFNQDGDWSDVGEQVFTSQGLSSGINTLSTCTPNDALVGDTFARFRFSSTGGLSYDGMAPDGEVEDYVVTITDPITVPVSVCAASQGHTASVADAGPGATYTWSITNGTIDTGEGTTTISFSADYIGPIVISVSVTDQFNCTAAYSRDVEIDPVPDSTITSTPSVCANSAGNTASIPDAGANAIYTWGITNGTITAGDGTASITFSTDATGPVSLSVTVENEAGCYDSSSLGITVDPLPDATITAPVSVCSSSPGHIASVSDAGANAIYTWGITNGTITAGDGTASITFSASATGPVNLLVTVENEAGCSDSGSLDITVDPLPDVTITAPASVCSGSAGHIASVPDAGTNATYTWGITNGTIATGDGTASITFSADATGPVSLSVTVDNEAGCSDSGSLDITVDPLPDVTITAPASVCSGSTGHIASVPDAGANAIYTWSITNGTIATGDGTSSITFSADATGPVGLSVTVQTEAGCSDNSSTNVIVDPLPDASISAPSSVCASSSGHTASVPNAGAGAIYTWGITNGSITSGAGTPNITFSAGASDPVSLTVTVQTAAGCSDSSSINVTIDPLPDASISAPSSACASSSGHTASVPDAGAGATYTWGITNGTITSGAGTSTITFSTGASGPVSLSVTVQTAAGCSDSSSTNVTVDPLPDASISAPSSVCASSSGHFASVPSAGAGATYSWGITNGTITSGNGTATITFSAGASGPVGLSVTVQTAASCSDSSSANVTVDPLPDASISAPASVCASSTGHFASVPSAGAGATYSWGITNGTITSGNGTATITFSAGASGPVGLSVTVQTAAGCTTSSSSNVTVDPLPDASISAPTSVCASSAGHTASVPSAGAGATYTWGITNGTITAGAGTSTITFSAAASGAVGLSVTVQTSAGCSTSSSTDVAVDPLPDATITAPSSVCASSSGHTASVPNAGGGATYSWDITNGTITSGIGTSTITFNAGTSGPVGLSVTVQTAAGCSTSSSANVAVDPLPDATITAPTSLCASSSGHIASVPNAGAGATYSWGITNGTITAGAGTSTITFSAAASGPVGLSVTVQTNAGCSTSSSTNVAVDPLPDATITAPTSLCASSSGHIASVPSAGAGATYSWGITNGTITAGAGTPTITFSTATSGPVGLSVTVQTNAGCSTSSSTNVAVDPLPDATITAPSSVCASSSGHTASVPSAGAGATYTWGITNGTITAGAGTSTITFNAAASGPVGLSVTVQTAAGCSTSSSTNVTIDPLPDASISAPTSVCASSSGHTASVASAGAGATYTWGITNGTITSGAGTSTITFSAGASGSVGLSVTVETAAGCSTSGSQSLAIDPLPAATITAPVSVCATSSGHTASVPSAGAGASYTWGITNGTVTGGEGTSTITFSAGTSGPVSLTVTVQTAAGCLASDGVQVIVDPLPDTTITAPASVRKKSKGNQASVPSAGAGASYTWTISNGTITTGQGTNTIEFSADQRGTLILGITITDAAGCTASGSQNITVY